MVSKQFLRYMVVGGFGTVTHLAILALFVEWMGQSVVLGAVVGFLGALSVSYVLNHRWAFESQRAHASSLWRYVLVALSGLVLNTSMMIALVHYFQWRYFTAQLSVIAIVPIYNYLLNRYWTFSLLEK